MSKYDVSSDVEASDLSAKDIGRLITFGKSADIASTVAGVFHGQLRSIKHTISGTEVGLIGAEADAKLAGTRDGEKILTFVLDHDAAIEMD
ncbi:hypothetical protein FDJ57_gp77 [Gordonia phage Sour]|uniref:Uncharacterized protein n=1 Tax=Gordonia phage Sour TaxID=2182349 RepID=A0A2U8UL13_9CAUD|nr:hypothetical protein FDJ57_gp77 [Gordonia phage Sour]AWN04278.1 hypothetical protein PBI_SOUR_77 [Gordonia phage Sour]